MRRIKSDFSLEVFDRRNAGSSRLPEYFRVYLDNFGRNHRTKTNELVYLLASPPDNRRIIYFGLSQGDVPCGFAVVMIFEVESISIIDHIVISPNNRGYSAFYVFCELIESYLDKKNINIEYAIAEIVVDDDHIASTVKPQMLIRLMRAIGFKVAKITYWAPDPLILENKEACRAAFMVRCRPERGQLSTTEFIRLVQLVYLRHYGDWYRRTMPEAAFVNYENKVRDTMKEIERLALRERRIILNGIKDVDIRITPGHVAAPDPSKLLYIFLLAIPAIVGAAVAFKQELYTAAIATAATLAAIILCLLISPLRRPLMRAFGLIE